MRVCPGCGCGARQDEQYKLTSLPEVGNCLACPACVARVYGLEPPLPRTYPVGERLPRGVVGDGDLPICGLCRLALYEDDSPQGLRLASEDVSDTLWAAYLEATAEARQAHAAVVKRSREVFDYKTSQPLIDRASAVTQARADLEAGLLRALTRASTPVEYAEREANLRAAYEQTVALAENNYEVICLGPRAERDAVIAQADFVFRRASVLAMEATKKLVSTAPPAVETGAYHACRDCVAKYRPRILARLIRLGVAPAHLTETEMTSNMLL